MPASPTRHLGLYDRYLGPYDNDFVASVMSSPSLTSDQSHGKCQVTLSSLLLLFCNKTLQALLPEVHQEPILRHQESNVDDNIKWIGLHETTYSIAPKYKAADSYV